MKVNFNVNFKDFKGNDTEFSISDKVAEGLFMAGSNPDLKIRNEDKFMAYKLSQRIIKGEIVDITAEEAALIKAVMANFMTAGAYGQVEEIIEGKK